jgi:hypothetical protein
MVHTGMLQSFEIGCKGKWFLEFVARCPELRKENEWINSKPGLANPGNDEKYYNQSAFLKK